jgi:hypothetical protein
MAAVTAARNSSSVGLVISRSQCDRPSLAPFEADAIEPSM